MPSTELSDLHLDRVGRLHTLTMRQWLPPSPEELFPFYADATNLERITPAILRFRVVSPTPVDMREGARIDYRLRLRGVPVGWRTAITWWDPPHGFRDEQLRGPYVLWRHTHTFEPSQGGTMTTDRVQYIVPGGPLAPLIHRVAVRDDVQSIFRFRAEALSSLFGAPSSRQELASTARVAAL
jgi:ligand-binding SRPBCC domain-containing protein